MSGEEKRPMSVKRLIGLVLFIGIGAVGGAIPLIIDPSGEMIGVSSDDLAGSIFPDFLIPALFLFLVLGVGSLVLAYGLWRRPAGGLLTWVENLDNQHWSWNMAVLLGVTLILFEIIQVSVLGIHWLHIIYLILGLAVIVLALRPAVRRYFQCGA